MQKFVNSLKLCGIMGTLSRMLAIVCLAWGILFRNASEVWWGPGDCMGVGLGRSCLLVLYRFCL